MRITMNDPRYGDAGPWDVEDGQTFAAAREALIEEMMPTLREWAREWAMDRLADLDMDHTIVGGISESEWIESRIDEMRDELRRAISVYGEDQ